MHNYKVKSGIPSFFFEMEAKELPHSLIKKKRVAQLIYGKPGENRYSNTTNTQTLPTRNT
jgi:hypothetical protein